MRENPRNSGIEKKRVEEAPGQREKCLKLRLESILSPAREMANLELADIIDIQAIQPLMNDFYKLTHIPIGINDLKGNVLVSVGWQDICTKFHRVHPETCKHCVESNIKLALGVTPGEFKMYKCKNNMWDIVTPIMVGDQHVGYVFGGQFFFEDEPVDYEFFRAQARQYGFNEEEYMAALEKVPRLSREAVETGMGFFMTFANILSQLSYSNIKLAQSLSERNALVNALQNSERRERASLEELTAVLDAVPVAVYIAHDPQVLQITGNRLSYEWLRLPAGTNLSKSAPEGEKPETFVLSQNGVKIPPADMPSQMAATGIEINDCELDIISADGEIRHVLGNARPLLDDQGNPRGSVSAFIDITERKNAEEALKKAYDNLEKNVKARTAELEEAYKSLRENERRLSEAQKMAHLGNWDRDILTGELYWSDEMYRLFGFNPQEFSATYSTFLSFIHPDDRNYVDNTVKKAYDEKSFDIDYRIILANGEERVVHGQGEVIFNEGNIPVRMRGTVQDITERKEAEEKIQSLANIVESSDDAIITESLDYIITSWNKGAEQVYGYSAEEILGKPIFTLAPPHLEEETKKLVERVKQGERVQQYATLRLRKDGRIINVSITLSPVFDIYGKLTAVSLIYRDITKRKEAEAALEKIQEAHIKEIHHRIKNNLQVISSLLDLQAEKFSTLEVCHTSEVVEAFMESQNRVASMALIHEELYKGDELKTLDFAAYLQNLTANLFGSYNLRNNDIVLKLDLEEIHLGMDTAIPLGIIVNELISNALKHAFPAGRAGEIHINLCKKESFALNYDIPGPCSSYMEKKGFHYVLTVADNGKGIPEEIEFPNTDSLGLQLVNILVEQIDGCIELKRNHGTKFTIWFSNVET
ncbi:MAG: PocR ligand-binding domain-containing protein [Methanosarcina sp.]